MRTNVKLFESAEFGKVLPVATEVLDGVEQLTIDARKLHAALRVGCDYSTWVRRRINEYNFVENQDFIVFINSEENSGRGRPSKEYRLSLDMGKELAMVENNEEGRKIRRYFIECEKALRANVLAQRPLLLDERLAAARIVLDCAGITGNQLALGIDRIYRLETGQSALESSGVELVAPMQTQLLTPTQIGKLLTPPLSARKVNIILELHDYQTNINGLWTPTEKGLEAGAVLMDTGKLHSGGTPVRQLKWPESILRFLKAAVV